MEKKTFPLEEISIEKLFINSDNDSANKTITYEIPIYQRNYAWQEDEINTLIQDVYDAFDTDKESIYYIGTLVSYDRGEGVYEIIDGQQRLTTIRLILAALGESVTHHLTYKARKKSDNTLKVLDDNKGTNIKLKNNELDKGIKEGLEYAKSFLDKHVKNSRNAFVQYFKNNVHLVHYKVPKDVDLNHYFEVMNSRGEQLEKHEIVKARLLNLLNEAPKNEKDDINNENDVLEQTVFGAIWESCSNMSTYVQHNMDSDMAKAIFGDKLDDFKPESFDEITEIIKTKPGNKKKQDFISISKLLESKNYESKKREKNTESEKDAKFQDIIDFPNFLLIVLKITRMLAGDFKGTDKNNGEGDSDKERFVLDDKAMLEEFTNAKMGLERAKQSAFAKQFAYNLLKAKYFLDNYIVHHALEEDTDNRNPWKLQMWKMGDKKGYPKDLASGNLQVKLIHLLSMFEVSFTPRPRKNYLFYILFYLIKKTKTNNKINLNEYAGFIAELADRYFYSVYLNSKNLYESSNIPKPGSFDANILKGNEFNVDEIKTDFNSNDYKDRVDNAIDDFFGNCKEKIAAKGRSIPLFVFNYLDYRLWNLYNEVLKGEGAKEDSIQRKEFFNIIGCDNFDLTIFKQFYFSRTRRSLEHFYPQAKATGGRDNLEENEINCLGNYAMIGKEMNSSGSALWPKDKLNRYKPDGKDIPFSVASLKFIIMMKVCEKNGWDREQIIDHQKKMIDILSGKTHLEKNTNKYLPMICHETKLNVEP